MRDAGGAVTHYLYDDVDRLIGMTLPSGKALELAYDAAGRRSSLRFPNGLSSVAGYDTPAVSAGTTGRLGTIAHGLDAAGAGGSALNQKLGTVSYSYDVKGDITGIAENAAVPRMRASAYDVLGRLTSVTDGAAQAVESYVLDAEGNRITSHLSNLHVTDPANRLVEDEQHLFEYDVNGNLVVKTEKASGQTWRYGYSAYDELVSVSRHPSAGAASDLTVTYAYDALGRRVSERKLDASGTVIASKSFLHDSGHVAVEADTDASGTLAEPRRYTHTDNVDDLAAITLSAGNGAVSPTAEATDENAPSTSSYYVHTDHQGTVRALTDDAGAVVNEYSYGSYGQPETAVEALPQPFRFTGREYDPDTGLTHYRSRAFDPQTGRFLQEDPIWFEAGDLNVYRYVWNSPANWTDPSGMSAATERAGLGAIATGLQAGLTINRVVRIAAWVRQWNGTRYIVREVVKDVLLQDKGLGCLIGLKLASIAATISGATDYSVDADNCSIVWNTAGDDPGKAGPSPEGKAGPAPSPEELEGLSPGEIDKKMRGLGWKPSPAKNGKGTRYENPDKIGEQVRVQPGGTPGTSRPDLHDDPYGIISTNGRKIRFRVGP